MESSGLITRSKFKEDNSTKLRSESSKRQHPSPTEIKSNLQQTKKSKNKNSQLMTDLEVNTFDLSDLLDQNEDVSNKKILSVMLNGFTSLSNQLQQFQSQLNELNGEVRTGKENFQKLKDNVKEQKEELDELKAEINCLNQQKLQNQVVIYGFPLLQEDANVTQAINDFFGTNFDCKHFKHIKMINNSNKTLTTCYLEFWDKRSAFSLLNEVKKKQKDVVSGKFIPILTEDIVPLLSRDDTRRGVQVNFKIPMTKYNKEIFNQARTCKLFKYVWVDQSGYVKVKRETDVKPTKVMSVSHLRNLVANINE